MNKSFNLRLAESLVIIIIICTLATVFAVAYNESSKRTKINSAKNNHNGIVQYVTKEIANCRLGKTTAINGRLICLERTASDVITATIAELTNYQNSYLTDNNAIRKSSSKNDVDIGFTNLSLSLGDKNIEVSTCFQKPCSNSNNKMQSILYDQ